MFHVGEAQHTLWRHTVHQLLPFVFLSFPCPVPMWAIGAIVVVVLALVACLGFCIYKKCFNKGKKQKTVRERKAGRGRRKKEKEGEDGEDKKVRRELGWVPVFS